MRGSQVGTVGLLLVLPVLAAIIGVVLPALHPPAPGQISGMRHFVAGPVLAAIALDVLPGLTKQVPFGTGRHLGAEPPTTVPRGPPTGCSSRPGSTCSSTGPEIEPGYGVTTRWLRQRGRRVTAAEVEPDLVADLRAPSATGSTSAPLTALPFPLSDATFDTSSSSPCCTTCRRTSSRTGCTPGPHVRRGTWSVLFRLCI